jgi:predicted amidohydrolase YtcJ
VEGSITPGKLANFVVLAQDPRRVPSAGIRDIAVHETWVDGKRAYYSDTTNGGSHAQR